MLNTISHVSSDITSAWAKQAYNANNPLGVSESLVDKTLKLCPPIHENHDNPIWEEMMSSGVIYMGRYIIPTAFVNYNNELQTRAKSNDQSNLQDLINDFKSNGILLDKQPPIAAYNGVPTVEGKSGYHRNYVIKTEFGQEVYFYDLYNFTASPRGEYYKEIVRNLSNDHKGAFALQTKHDYYKSVVNSIQQGLIENSVEAIDEYVEIIARPLSETQKKWIKKEAIATESAVANFKTYSTQRGQGVKGNISSALKEMGLPAAGIENRSRKEIQDQGFILYCAADGDSQSAWMRAISNSVKYNVPVYIIGYSAHTKPSIVDLQSFREEWIDDFEMQKNVMQDFVSKVIDDDFEFITFESNFPVRMGGFLPQYTKPNPNDNGAPTEHTIVDVSGKPFNII
jgi:hypothetical protein